MSGSAYSPKKEENKTAYTFAIGPVDSSKKDVVAGAGFLRNIGNWGDSERVKR